MRGVLAAALTGTAVLASGCQLSVGAGLDTSRLEEEIARDLAREGDVEVAAVTCPTDIGARQGDVFVCRATGPDGTTYVIEVMQTDDEGAVNWRVTAALTEPPTAEG